MSLGERTMNILNKRSHWTTIGILVVLGIGSIYILAFHEQQAHTSPDFYQYLPDTSYYRDSKQNSAATVVHNCSKLHLERIERITKICKSREHLQNGVYKDRSLPIYYYSPKYNFSYCKVPKGGSTFWTQTFSILENGPKTASKVFKTARFTVHNSLSQFEVKFYSKARKNSQSIIVARDPYLRLFSAYIDKSYVPMMMGINVAIKLTAQANSSICLGNVTFQEFLEYVISTVMQGGTLNRHWAPIYSLCRPCDVNPFILVKLETFSKDVEYSLKTVGAEEQEFDAIIDGLKSHRIESTIPGIVVTLIKKVLNNKRIRNCYGYSELAKRIWTSFQIQGFIDRKVEFPSDVFDTLGKVLNSTFFTGVVLNTIKTHPLSSAMSKLQRHEALVNAYKDIPMKVIKQLQHIYSNDIELFDYNPLPPNMR